MIRFFLSAGDFALIILGLFLLIIILIWATYVHATHNIRERATAKAALDATRAEAERDHYRELYSSAVKRLRAVVGLYHDTEQLDKEIEEYIRIKRQRLVDGMMMIREEEKDIE